MTITVKSKIEKGWIRLPKKVRLPDDTRIIVKIEPILKTKDKQKMVSELSGSWSISQTGHKSNPFHKKFKWLCPYPCYDNLQDYFHYKELIA